jgi:hypothetical protein
MKATQATQVMVVTSNQLRLLTVVGLFLPDDEPDAWRLKPGHYAGKLGL